MTLSEKEGRCGNEWLPGWSNRAVQLELLGCIGDASSMHPNNPEITHRTDRATGWIEWKYIPRNGKNYGPYAYFRWWDGGVLRSKYLGTKSRMDEAVQAQDNEQSNSDVPLVSEILKKLTKGDRLQQSDRLP